MSHHRYEGGKEGGSAIVEVEVGSGRKGAVVEVEAGSGDGGTGM